MRTVVGGKEGLREGVRLGICVGGLVGASEGEVEGTYPHVRARERVKRGLSGLRRKP